MSSTVDTASKKTWSPLSWKSFPIQQMPNYADKVALEKAFRQLQSYPPLTTSWEIESLRSKLVQVGRGEAFILQGGDCAERFEDCNPKHIVNLMKVLLQMSFILLHEMNLPIIRVGRIAGQYAKPRSSDTEVVNGETMNSYRGDIINGFEADSRNRLASPERLVEGYHKAGLTLNFLRSLVDDGFADLHHPETWELDFMQGNPFYREYKDMVRSIQHAIGFMESLKDDRFNALQKVDYFTSHEALNLWYESAQTRQVPRRDGWFNLSSHMVWIGNRTRQLDGAHIEYCKGIRNPIGVKVGPGLAEDELLALLDALNPANEEGKIVLISRMGKDKVAKELPTLLRRIKAEGKNVIWQVDPMHGNTFSTKNGTKTRNFDDILQDVKESFAAHRAEGTYLGGVHLELTGNNVTECVGGAQGLNEDGLDLNYQTYCDPRLNYEQSLEMAFLVAREWKLGYK